MVSPSKKPLHEKLLTKETSISYPSFRVYYGEAAGTIPFHWESQPGTPKKTNYSSPKSNDHFALPPLTPPPSYFYYLNPNYKKKSKAQSLLHIILPKLFNLRRARVSYLSSSSSSSSSSDQSSLPAAVKLSHPNSYFSYYKEDRDIKRDSHVSMFCFRHQR